MARKWPVRSSGQSPADQGLTGRLEGAFDGEVDCLGQRRARLAGGENVEGLLGLLAIEAGAGQGLGNGAVALDVAQSRSEERRVGKSVSVRVDLGGRRIIKKKKMNVIHECTEQVEAQLRYSTHKN